MSLHKQLDPNECEKNVDWNQNGTISPEPNQFSYDGSLTHFKFNFSSSNWKETNTINWN